MEIIIIIIISDTLKYMEYFSASFLRVDSIWVEDTSCQISRPELLQSTRDNKFCVFVLLTIENNRKYSKIRVFFNF